MKINSKTNFYLDAILLILLLLTIFTIIGGKKGSAVSQQALSPTNTSQILDILHFVFGGLLFIISILHIFFHWEWIKTICFHPSRKLAKKIRANRATVNWLAIIFILCGFTGLITWLVQENVVEPFLLSAQSWSGMHRLTGTITLLMMLVRTVQHWKWIVFTTRRYLGIRNIQHGLSQEILPESKKEGIEYV